MSKSGRGFASVNARQASSGRSNVFTRQVDASNVDASSSSNGSSSTTNTSGFSAVFGEDLGESFIGTGGVNPDGGLLASVRSCNLIRKARPSVLLELGFAGALMYLDFAY